MNPIVGTIEFQILLIDPITRIVDIYGKVSFTFTDPVPALLDVLEVETSSQLLDVDANYNITF